MLPERFSTICKGIILAFALFTTGWNSLQAPKELLDARPREDLKVVPSARLPNDPSGGQINFTDYPLNEGQGYELPPDKIPRFIKADPLVIWQDNFKDPSQSGYVSVGQMKDLEGRPLRPEQAIRLFRLDLDGDKVEEVVILPNQTFGTSYRPTVLQRAGSRYLPIKVADITGDNYDMMDIRDLNGDQRLDFILHGSSGASSYEDITEVFWQSDKNLNSQVFKQWVRLRDFDRSGVFQLLVDSIGGTSGPHSEWAGWTDIYKWNGRNYENANVEYAAYYEKELIPEYISEILNYTEDIVGTTDVIQDRIALVRKAQETISQNIPYGVIHPLQAALHHEKGMVFLKQNQPAEAIEELTQAVRWDPKSPELLNSLIQAYLVEGDYEQAEVCSLKLIGLAPDQATAWTNLGYTYAKQGKQDKAVRSLKVYLQFTLDPDEGVNYLMDLFKKDSDPRVRDVLQKVLPELSTRKVGKVS